MDSKIMQSFKQYLKEDNFENKQVDFTMTFAVKGNITDIELKHFDINYPEIFEKYKVGIAGVDTYANYYTIDVSRANIPSSIYSSKEQLLAFQDKILKALSEHEALKNVSITVNNGDAYSSSFLRFRFIPKIVIDWPVIRLNCSHIDSLEGIGNAFTIVDHLRIFNFLNIKSNILGLFKLKGNIRITPGTHGNEKQTKDCEDFIKTINGYLESKMNPLKAQKELIQNGFKDYAKF